MNRKLIRQVTASQPHIKSNHREPMTRRELFGAGYLAMGGLVVLPRLDGFLSERAFAQGGETCLAGSTGNRNMSAVLCVDLGGGATLPFNFPPLDVNGNPLSPGSYASIGMSAELDPNTVELDTTFGIPMNPNSRMLAGMRTALGFDAPETQVAAAAMAARVNGYITCVANSDDTQNNEHNLLMGLSKLGYSRLIHAVGNSDNANGSGARSAPVADWYDATKIPVTVLRKEDAINIVLPPILKEYLPSEAYSKVTAMIRKWSVSEQTYFLSKGEDEQISIIRRMADKDCVYQQSGDLVSRYSLEDIDIDLDSNVEFRTIWQADKGTGSIVKLLADDIASGGAMTMGGYDYHGQGAATQNARDLQAGVMLGQIIRSFCLKGKNVMISLYTDGGTSSGGDAPDANEQRIAATGDSGARGLRVTIFVNGAGTTRPAMTRNLKQFGAYNQTGAVEGSADDLISSSPAKCCAVDLVNLLKFDGNLDLAENLDLPDAAKYGIMVETKPS